ncbi:hypothetical protein CEXT_549351 [Caerostris extrusa]|uniref:Uncharacterized protein n=1 Tax=Caerostris extrusa TaxID=172846 RepID=A0AAV4MMQ3_CAEEX|nr:hypothetical protein CEXT_549351 [Caerostris extrusa]
MQAACRRIRFEFAGDNVAAIDFRDQEYQEGSITLAASADTSPSKLLANLPTAIGPFAQLRKKKPAQQASDFCEPSVHKWVHSSEISVFNRAIGMSVSLGRFLVPSYVGEDQEIKWLLG